MTPSRRQFLFGSAASALAATAGCGTCGGERREAPPGPSSAPTMGSGAAGRWRELVWTAAEVPPGGQAALVLPGPAEDQAPLLVALHGRGEAGRGLSTGARGWRDDYAVEAVDARLRGGTLDGAALGGFATAERIAAIRASLAATPYRGLTLVTPYTPIVSDARPEGAGDFTRFVDEQLIPRAIAAAGLRADAVRCGIDGVSMGGRLALWAASLRPSRFASVGALQPALSLGEADGVAGRLADAHREAPFALRLVSSDGDPFLAAVRALAARLEARGVPCGLVVTPGPHDYAWNRGPGSAELLLHHERVLRGLPPP